MSKLCARLLGGSLGMSCLIGMSLFAWESWVTLDSLTKKLRVQALSHMVQSTSRGTGDWDPPHRQSIMPMPDGPPVKTVDTKAQVSFPGWQCSVSIVTCQCQGTNTALMPQEEDNFKLHVWKPPGLSSPQLLPWLIFNLYPLAVTNCNCECNCSQSVLWVLPVNCINTWGWLWEPSEFAVGVRSEESRGHTLPSTFAAGELSHFPTQFRSKIIFLFVYLFGCARS